MICTQQSMKEYEGYFVRILFSNVHEMYGIVKGVFRDFIVFDVSGEQEIRIPYKKIYAVYKQEK